MAFTLVEFLAALLFVASSGIFFQERYRRNRVLVACAGAIALVSTYLLTEEIIDRAISHRLASIAEQRSGAGSVSGSAESPALTESSDVPPSPTSPPRGINATDPDISAASTSDDSASQGNTLDAAPAEPEYNIGNSLADSPPGTIVGRVEQVRANERYLIVQLVGSRPLAAGSSVWISTEVGTLVRGNVERISGSRFSVTVGSQIDLITEGDSVRVVDL